MTVIRNYSHTCACATNSSCGCYLRTAIISLWAPDLWGYYSRVVTRQRTTVLYSNYDYSTISWQKGHFLFSNYMQLEIKTFCHCFADIWLNTSARMKVKVSKKFPWFQVVNRKPQSFRRRDWNSLVPRLSPPPPLPQLPKERAKSLGTRLPLKDQDSLITRLPPPPPPPSQGGSLGTRLRLKH